MSKRYFARLDSTIWGSLYIVRYMLFNISIFSVVVNFTGKEK